MKKSILSILLIGIPALAQTRIPGNWIFEGGVNSFQDIGLANAYQLSPTPAISAYDTYANWCFLPAHSNTGASTLQFNGLGAKAIQKSGSLALTGGEISANQPACVVYDGTAFQLLGAAGGGGSGTVTNVATGTGLTGGPISTTGTISMANMAANSVKGNATGGSAAPTDIGLTAPSFFQNYLVGKFPDVNPPGTTAGNEPMDLFLNHATNEAYICAKAAGTAAPACTGVGSGNWIEFGMLANTQTWSGTNTFSSGLTLSGILSGTQVSCLGLDASNHVVLNAAACGSGGSGITQLTGDVTAGPGSGSQVATLASTAVTAGSYTNANITVDAKGRLTAASNGSAGTVPTITVPNAGVTGTTVNTLTKIVGTTAVILATTDTNGSVGITTSGAGTTGSATISTIGSLSCVFDGATTGGDYVGISSTTAGNCHDIGATPAAGQTIGRIPTTNATGGTYTMDLFPAAQPPVTAGFGMSPTYSAAGLSLAANTSVMASNANVQSGAPVDCSSTTGTATYVCTMTPAVVSYTNDMTLTFKADTNSATTCSLDAGGGAKTLYLADGVTGCGTAIKANAGYLVKYDSSLSGALGGWRLLGSGCNLSGTTLTCQGAITAGSPGGVGGAITLPEGTSVSGSSGNDVCYADSTAHAVKCSFNNGTAQTIVLGSSTTTTTTQVLHATSTAGVYAPSAVVTADLPAQYTKGACSEVWGGSGTSFALTSGDDSISNNTCYNDSGVTRTITAVKCLSDNATNTTTVNPTMGSAGTGTTILTGALTCGNSNAYSASGTLSATSWTTGTGIDPAMGGVLTGTHIAMIVEYTY